MPPRTALRALLFTSWLALGLSAVAGAAAPSAEADPLVVAGSDSMGPLLERVAGLLGPDVDVSVEARGSETGPVALLRGRAAIASLTRPLNDTERAGFRARYGREPVAFAIALDAVAVLVNADNPLQETTLERIAAAFGEDPACGGGVSVERWGAFGATAEDFADRRIGLYAPPPESGTRSLFRELALCGGRIAPRARRQPGTASVALAVAESRFGLGIATLADLSPRVRALSLPARDGSGPVAPLAEDVRAGRYPFSRDLLLLALADDAGELPGPVRRFLDAVLSDEGQAAVAEAGFLSLPAERLATERARLAD